MEGPAANCLAVIEFEDFDTALAFYNSPEYAVSRRSIGARPNPETADAGLDAAAKLVIVFGDLRRT